VIALAVGSGASHGCGTMVTIVEKSVGEEEWIMQRVNEKDVMGLQWKGSNRNPNTSKRLRACVVLLDKTWTSVTLQRGLWPEWFNAVHVPRKTLSAAGWFDPPKGGKRVIWDMSPFTPFDVSSYTGLLCLAHFLQIWLPFPAFFVQALCQ
jgi:hypothetical protein